MSSLRSRVNAEVAELADANGTVKPADVVRVARRKGTALHEDFAKQGLWDDKRAAERARLEYAARVIRLYVVRDVSEGSTAPIRALVSVMEDRKPASGLPGYRRIGDVLKDQTLREQLIQTALSEARALRRKYEHLRELAEIWSAIDSADKRHHAPRREEAQASA